MQPRGERLLQANEEIPRQELAAVGVAGELQVEAGGGCSGRAARLVREDDAHRSVGRAAGERAGGVADVGAVEVAGAEVGDAADDERCAGSK